MQELVSKRKLLLADDSVTIQKVVNLTFADEGIEVVSVGDGNAAMDKLREDPPDIVLADVNMPGLTGYEICAKIKERDTGDQIPVVLLVGSFEPFDEEEAERVGADGYLTKPFQSISQLVDKVSELLGIETEDTLSLEAPEFAERGDSEFAESAGHTAEDEHMGAFHESKDHLSDFQDEDEFEMSEAFGDDEKISGINEAALKDRQIEEVPGDFLKTQPLSESDLQDILDDSESEIEFDGDSGEGIHQEHLGEGGFSTVEGKQEHSFGEFDTPEGNTHQQGEERGNWASEGSQSEFPLPEVASALDLDEINLLEVPPVDSNAEADAGQSLAGVGGRRAKSERYNIASDVDEFDEGADIMVQTMSGSSGSAAAAPVTEAKALEMRVAQEVSKDMVEAITRRVIETLSERAIREIAWEVVPDLADLIIKKMAEDKMKN